MTTLEGMHYGSVAVLCGPTHLRCLRLGSESFVVATIETRAFHVKN